MMSPSARKRICCCSRRTHWMPTKTSTPSSSQIVTTLKVRGSSLLIARLFRVRRRVRRTGHSQPAADPAIAPALAQRWAGVQAAPHHLVDRAEQAGAAGVLHLDADAVAVAHEGGLRRAGLDRLDRALLGDAGVAVVPVLVADGAAADDGPARTLRVLPMCAISWPKWNVISGPALQRPTRSPFQRLRGRGAGGRPAMPRRARRA